MLHAGIVDEDIDRPDLALEPVDRLLNRRMIRYIEGKDARAGSQ